MPCSEHALSAEVAVDNDLFISESILVFYDTIGHTESPFEMSLFISIRFSHIEHHMIILF